MNQNKSIKSSELKALARGQLLGKYGTVVPATMLLLLLQASLTFSSEITIASNLYLSYIVSLLFSLVISVFLFILTIGNVSLYMNIACSRSFSLSNIFDGFKIPAGRTGAAGLLFAVIESIGLFPAIIWNLIAFSTPRGTVAGSIIIITSILGTVISIYLSICFSMVPFAMLDFPQYSIGQLFKMSRWLIRGSKWRFFYIQLSFIPLLLLSALSCGIASFWVLPYKNAVLANFYLTLTASKEASEA